MKYSLSDSRKYLNPYQRKSTGMLVKYGGRLMYRANPVTIASASPGSTMGVLGEQPRPFGSGFYDLNFGPDQWMIFQPGQPVTRINPLASVGIANARAMAQSVDLGQAIQTANNISGTSIQGPAISGAGEILPNFGSQYVPSAQINASPGAQPQSSSAQTVAPVTQNPNTTPYQYNQPSGQGGSYRVPMNYGNQSSVTYQSTVESAKAYNPNLVSLPGGPPSNYPPGWAQYPGGRAPQPGYGGGRGSGCTFCGINKPPMQPINGIQSIQTIPPGAISQPPIPTPPGPGKVFYPLWSKAFSG